MELIATEPMAPPAAAAPAAASGHDFWAKMDFMLDRKMNTMAQQFGPALITLEVTMEIQREREERKAEAQLAENRTDKVIERLEKLEKKEMESSP